MLVAHSCSTLCDPMNCSPSGSSVHGILQARILQWVAIPFSKGSSWSRDQSWVSFIAGRFFARDLFIHVMMKLKLIYMIPSLGTLLACYFFFNFLFYIGVELINQRRQWQATPVLLPGESHGQRSLVGCSPWGYKSDTTEQLRFHFSLSRIGEGNGSPLQCSCLENPRDGGA